MRFLFFCFVCLKSCCFSSPSLWNKEARGVLCSWPRTRRSELVLTDHKPQAWIYRSASVQHQRRPRAAKHELCRRRPINLLTVRRSFLVLKVQLILHKHLKFLCSSSQPVSLSELYHKQLWTYRTGNNRPVLESWFWVIQQPGLIETPMGFSVSDFSTSMIFLFFLNFSSHFWLFMMLSVLFFLLHFFFLTGNAPLSQIHWAVLCPVKHRNRLTSGLTPKIQASF